MQMLPWFATRQKMTHHQSNEWDDGQTHQTDLEAMTHTRASHIQVRGLTSNTDRI